MEREKQRDVGSEIDYSDHKSILSVNRKAKRYKKGITKEQISQLSGSKTRISKGGGGSVFSDAMSLRSKLSKISKYSKKSENSIVTDISKKTDKNETKSVKSNLEKVKEETGSESGSLKCQVCDSELTVEEAMFNNQIVAYKNNKQEDGEEKDQQQDEENKISEIVKDILKNSEEQDGECENPLM